MVIGSNHRVFRFHQRLAVLVSMYCSCCCVFECTSALFIIAVYRQTVLYYALVRSANAVREGAVRFAEREGRNMKQLEAARSWGYLMCVQ